MASFTPFVADEEQASPLDPASSSESDKEPAATGNWSRRLAAGLAACTATYAVGRAVVHGLALDSGAATLADPHSAARTQRPPFEAKYDDDHYDADDPSADAGASTTYPKQAGEVRKGSHVMIKGHACKVVDFSTSKTGKHGHAKAHIMGVDIFTGKKFEELCPAGHNIDVPFVKRTELDLISADPASGEVSLLLPSGDMKEDLILPNFVWNGEPSDDDKKVSKEIVDAQDAGKDIRVIVLSAIGQEKIVAVKETE